MASGCRRGHRVVLPAQIGGAKWRSTDPRVYMSVRLVVFAQYRWGTFGHFIYYGKSFLSQVKVLVIEILWKGPLYLKTFWGKKSMHKASYKCLNVFVPPPFSLPVYSVILINAAF